MQNIILRTHGGEVSIRVQGSRITMSHTETPSLGGSRHIQQMIRRPEKVMMMQAGHMPRPDAEEREHRWGTQGIARDIDGLCRLLRRAGVFRTRQDPRQQQGAQDALRQDLSDEQWKQLCPEWHSGRHA